MNDNNYFKKYFRILGFLIQVAVAQTTGSNVSLLDFNIILPTAVNGWPSALATKEYTYKTKFTLPYNNYTEADFDPHIEISQELQQNILNQFNKINDTLQDTIKIFTTENNDELLKPKSTKSILSRIVRSVPRVQREECTATKDELNELKTIIHNTLTNIAATPSDTNCEINTSDDNTDNCNKLLKLIQCGVNHLKNGFLKATANKASMDEVTKWKNAYNSLQEKFQKGYDHVKRSVSQEYQQLIDTLKTELQYLGKQLNTTLYNLQEKLVRFCISEISNGKTANAVTLYKERDDDSKLAYIIKTAYNEYGHINNVNNIINFIKGLPNCNQDKIAFPVLFELMRANDNLKSPEVLIFVKEVNQCMSSSSLENELKKHTNEIIDTWANKIRKDNYNDFIKIVKKNCGHFLDDYWSQIIEKAYANKLANAENILKFIRSLPCVNNIARALKALFDQMRNNNHLDSDQLLMFAFKIKQELDYVLANPNFQYGPGGQQYYKEKYEYLKGILPSSVRSLIWNGNRCTIRNTYWDEYLYASTIRNDDTRRKIFTWIPKGMVTQGYWIITPIDNAKSFTIKNTVHNEYLYASTFLSDHTRRKPFTWTSGGAVSQGYWKLTPGNNAKYFMIKNTVHNEYLYASKYWDHDTRRKVYTWTPGHIVREGDWDIQC